MRSFYYSVFVERMVSKVSLARCSMIELKSETNIEISPKREIPKYPRRTFDFVDVARSYRTRITSLSSHSDGLIIHKDSFINRTSTISTRADVEPHIE